MKTPADDIVNRLLEDEEYSFEDIKAYVEGHPVNLTDGIEFHIGFEIATSSQGLIEDNARERGIAINWDVVNDAILRMEKNALLALAEAGIQVREEGHTDNGLAGSAWVTGGTPGFKIVADYIEHDEPYSTSRGTLGHIKKGLELSVYAGVPESIGGIIDVDIYFFGFEKIQKVENGEDFDE